MKKIVIAAFCLFVVAQNSSGTLLEDFDNTLKGTVMVRYPRGTKQLAAGDVQAIQEALDLDVLFATTCNLSRELLISVDTGRVLTSAEQELLLLLLSYIISALGDLSHGDGQTSETFVYDLACGQSANSMEDSLMMLHEQLQQKFYVPAH